MALVIKGSSSGQVTVDVPATAGTNTVTMPAETGTAITSATTSHIIEVDMFRLNADLDGHGGTITSNLERCDTNNFSKIGTGMSQSSGLFTFPRTGVYQITVQADIQPANADGTCVVSTQVCTDGSTYVTASNCHMGDDSGTNSIIGTAYSQCFFNVTDTSTHKARFLLSSFASGSLLRGNGSQNETCFSFIRLGDSQ